MESIELGIEEMDTTDPHPVSRLCPIYLQDLLQLTSRNRIERYREVSRYCNSVVCTMPDAMLPRRYLEIAIETVSFLYLSFSS